MSKIAVIGDNGSICGFAALGLETHPAKDGAEAAKALHRMAGSDYAVIYITEATARDITADIDKYSDRSTPAIIIIPGITGNSGMGLSNLKKSVEKAVGSDILN